VLPIDSLNKIIREIENNKKPGGKAFSGVILNSKISSFGGTPALRKWPISGFFNLFRFFCPAPIWRESTPSFSFVLT
jgi:hypothetical protein